MEAIIKIEEGYLRLSEVLGFRFVAWLRVRLLLGVGLVRGGGYGFVRGVGYLRQSWLGFMFEIEK